MPLVKNNMALLSLFQFALVSLFLSFTFLFNLFCFSSLYQRVVYWISWTFKWIQTACYFRREKEWERERESPKSSHEGGGRVVRWLWVNFQCRGVVLIWIIIGQGPIALSVGVGKGCLDIFSLVCLSFFCVSISSGTARYKLKYCLKGPLNPKQPTH